MHALLGLWLALCLYASAAPTSLPPRAASGLSAWGSSGFAGPVGPHWAELLSRPASDPAFAAAGPALERLGSDPALLDLASRWDSLEREEKRALTRSLYAALASSMRAAAKIVRAQESAARAAVFDGAAPPSALRPAIAQLDWAARLYGSHELARRRDVLRVRMDSLEARRLIARSAQVLAAVGLHKAPETGEELKSFLERRHGDVIATRPDLFKLKLKKAAASDFAFFRGFPELFYLRLKGSPSAGALARSARLRLDGDFHAENVELVDAGKKVRAPQVNDLDDAALGPAALDLARLLSGAGLLEPSRAAWLVAEARAAYLAALAETFGRWTAALGSEPAVARARPRDRDWKNDAGVPVRDPALAARLRAAAGLSGEWKPHDRRGAGLSSIGMRRYLFLSDAEEHVYELKELRGAAPEFFTGPSGEPDAERVARGYAELRQIPTEARTVVFDEAAWSLRRREAAETRLELSHARSSARVLGGLLAQLHRPQAAQAALEAAASAITDADALSWLSYMTRMRALLKDLLDAGTWNRL